MKRAARSEPPSQHRPSPAVLGWCELVRLTGLGLPPLPAKLDTGARTAALHATDIVPLRHGDRDFVAFVVHPGRDRGARVELEAEVVTRRRIRSSNGELQQRYVVHIEVELAGQRWTAAVSLTDRRRMAFPLLLGREALDGRFVIDPGRCWTADARGARARS